VAGTKRGQGKGTFVGSVLGCIDTFYEHVVQHIKPWTPPAPTPRTRQAGEDAVPDRDDISGELPLKSVQRASTVPEWKPPESANESDRELEYTTDVPPPDGQDGVAGPPDLAATRIEGAPEPEAAGEGASPSPK
jgi:hypothetical protein